MCTRVLVCTFACTCICKCESARRDVRACVCVCGQACRYNYANISVCLEVFAWRLYFNLEPLDCAEKPSPVFNVPVPPALRKKKIFLSATLLKDESLTQSHAEARTLYLAVTHTVIDTFLSSIWHCWGAITGPVGGRLLLVAVVMVMLLDLHHVVVVSEKVSMQAPEAFTHLL